MSEKELSKGLPAEISMEIKSLQMGEYSNFHFEETGRIVYLNDAYYIRYEETQDQEKIPVTIKINSEGHVVLLRQGTVSNRMVFDSKQETTSNYKTDVGSMQIRVVTDDLKFSYQDQPFAGQLAVDYRLFSGDQHMGDFEIRLQFTT